MLGLDSNLTVMLTVIVAQVVDAVCRPSRHLKLHILLHGRDAQPAQPLFGSCIREAGARRARARPF